MNIVNFKSLNGSKVKAQLPALSYQSNEAEQGTSKASKIMQTFIITELFTKCREVVFIGFGLKTSRIPAGSKMERTPNLMAYSNSARGWYVSC